MGLFPWTHRRERRFPLHPFTSSADKPHFFFHPLSLPSSQTGRKDCPEVVLRCSDAPIRPAARDAARSHVSVF
jgi:hypothetical protein